MGGYFYQISISSPILFQQLPGGPLTDACQFDQPAVSAPLGAVVAFVHTHQAPEGVPVYCEHRGVTLVPNNSATGAGSPQDWAKAKAQRVPEYTVDANSIWRLDPNVDPSQWSANVNRWIRQGVACATHAEY